MNITSKETDYGSLKVLLDEINKDLPRVAKQNFNIDHQYTSLKNLREDLSFDELIVHIDFFENYNCKYGSEIQSMHFESSISRFHYTQGLPIQERKLYHSARSQIVSNTVLPVFEYICTQY